MLLQSCCGDDLRNVTFATSLVIAGVIGIALFLAVMWLSDILFRKYFLTVNVFNFDAKNVWKSITWYADNAEISNDEWKTAQVAAFAPAGMSYDVRVSSATLTKCTDRKWSYTSWIQSCNKPG